MENRPKRRKHKDNPYELNIIDSKYIVKFKDNKKEYVVYTKNETDENGNVTVYVSNVDRSSGEPKLLGIDNESEWDRIKDVLRELSKPEAE